MVLTIDHIQVKKEIIASAKQLWHLWDYFFQKAGGKWMETSYKNNTVYVFGNMSYDNNHLPFILEAFNEYQTNINMLHNISEEQLFFQKHIIECNNYFEDYQFVLSNLDINNRQYQFIKIIEDFNE